MPTFLHRESSAFSLVLLNSKLVTAAAVGLLALDIKIDAGLATVITGLFVAISSMWQSWMLTRVHTLVNSNFTEAKAARLAAEASLKTANDQLVVLQRQLDSRQERP